MSIRAALSVLALAVTIGASTSVVADTLPGPLRTVVIDPGHGGEDGGACGVAGIDEKELTLEVAHLVRERLAERAPGLRVVLTREIDEYPTLEDRSHLAHVVGADLFVSVHFNAAVNPAAEGIETWYLDPTGTVPGEPTPGREDEGPSLPRGEVGVTGDVHAFIVDDLRRDGAHRLSAAFADTMQGELMAATDATDRGVRQGQFRVLRGVRAPAVVVELGFLSHVHEGKVSILDERHDVLADALVDAILAWDVQATELAADLDGVLDSRYEVAHGDATAQSVAVR